MLANVGVPRHPRGLVGDADRLAGTLVSWPTAIILVERRQARNPKRSGADPKGRKMMAVGREAPDIGQQK